MHDLSPAFENARRNSHDWSRQNVRELLLQLVSSQINLHVDWEEGDEDWGIVHTKDIVVAFACVKVPFVFLHMSIVDSAGQLREDNGIAVEVVKNFDDKSYSVSRPLLEQIFGRPISENVDYDAISINDLWWATV